MIAKLHRFKHSMIVRMLVGLAAVSLSVAALTGCGASDADCQGDPGKVTEKEYEKATKTDSTADYDLTILKADGTTYEKEVSSTAYDEWYKVGSKFPSSKHCKDGKVTD